MSTSKLYPSAPPEPIANVEEGLQKKLNDIDSFNDCIKTILKNR